MGSWAEHHRVGGGVCRRRRRGHLALAGSLPDSSGSQLGIRSDRDVVPSHRSAHARGSWASRDDRLRFRSTRHDGNFCIVRNPIYSAWIVFIIPGLVLFSRSWPLLLTPVVAYVVFKIMISRETEYLEQRFGDAFLKYRAEVPELFPRPRFRRCGRAQTRTKHAMSTTSVDMASEHSFEAARRRFYGDQYFAWTVVVPSVGVRVMVSRLASNSVCGLPLTVTDWIGLPSGWRRRRTTFLAVQSLGS